MAGMPNRKDDWGSVEPACVLRQGSVSGARRALRGLDLRPIAPVCLERSATRRLGFPTTITYPTPMRRWRPFLRTALARGAIASGRVGAGACVSHSTMRWAGPVAQEARNCNGWRAHNQTDDLLAPGIIAIILFVSAARLRICRNLVAGSRRVRCLTVFQCGQVWPQSGRLAVRSANVTFVEHAAGSLCAGKLCSRSRF